MSAAFPAPQTLSMRTADGARLDADVYSPPQGGRCPVLLMRQPYGRRIASTVTYAHPAWYASHGYMVVVQDVRGRGTSEGEFDPLVHEMADGRDTLDWAADLPGSNGRIGMYGFSYQGATQLFAAANRHPALVTICPAMSPFSLRDDWAFEGGAESLAGNLGWAAHIAAGTARRRGDHDRYARLCELGQAPTAAELFDAAGPAVRGLLAGSHYDRWLDEPPDSPYWSQRSPAAVLPVMPLPTLHVGGWFDCFLTGTVASHARFAAGGAPQRLVIGPWVHLPWSRMVGASCLGAEAHPQIDALQLRWFDHHLKGIDGRFDAATAVRLHDVRSGVWHQSADWPDTTTLCLYLGSDGLASMRDGGGSLAEAPRRSRPDFIVHDPWRPVPGVGGHLPPSMGIQDRTEVDARTDVAVYTGAPLVQALQLIGTVSLTLHATADAQSFDIAAVLSVVGRDGRARNLTQGSLRANAGGQQVIAMRFVCARLEPGECLRLSVCGASYPAIGLNPGRPGVPGSARAADYPIITLCLGGGPSWLELPVVPA